MSFRWPLRAHSLDGLGLDAIRGINSLVRAHRRPALGRCHRRPHRHVVRASSRDSIDEHQRSCPRPWVRTPTVCPAL
eukprot:3433585-Heterocapsa_arctica.AAC.1